MQHAKLLTAAAALTISAPALGQTYAVTGSGVVVPAIPPAAPEAPAPRVSYRIPASATAKAAVRYEIAYLTLSAIDAAQTISCLHRGVCREANPLFGSHPKPAKLIAGKIALGALHFAAFSRLNDRNPKAALRMAQISAGIQGGVVALNMRFTFGGGE